LCRCEDHAAAALLAYLVKLASVSSPELLMIVAGLPDNRLAVLAMLEFLKN
jgi:hypothetical protein